VLTDGFDPPPHAYREDGCKLGEELEVELSADIVACATVCY
jgi:hypothetical protein